ncbi:hypothetical protein M2322_003014 [Rhodoblastus acidophilus]|uniref:hypothetical protein n=1 Tax=Rhodoblastus acidophilus TaxID=1074 RepID=UPI0022244080|nr:hypothetical protein [Rhodoblastus acidophilus]MCW2317455.1 hypothetical protein [Rhodoblastus acidophilus]
MSKVIEEFATATFASDINDFGAPDVAAGLDACDHSEYWNAFVQGRPDWIITNPPFSPDPPLKSAAEMLPGFLHFARVGVALLCRLQWLETEERHALLSEFPPSLVAIFSERVPMCEGGYDPKCKSASAYAWFIWKRQEDGQWPRCLADGQFTAFLIPPGQKKAWFKPSDLLLAKRHVPGFVPPSARRKEREAGRLSEPMAIVLRNLIEGRSAFWHISGVSEHGGASGTSLALRKRGFVDHDFQITEAGKLALEKWSAR